MAFSDGAVLTTTGVSTGQDMVGVGEMLVLLDVLVVGGTNPSMTINLQLAPTLNGTYVDIPGTTVGPLTGVGRTEFKVDADQCNGFIRANYALSGTNPTFTVALNLIGLLLHDSTRADLI